MRVVFPTKMSNSLVMATPGPGRGGSAPVGARTARAGRAAAGQLPGAPRFGSRLPEPEKDHFRDRGLGGRSGGEGGSPSFRRGAGKVIPNSYVIFPTTPPPLAPLAGARREWRPPSSRPCLSNQPPHFLLVFLPLSLPFSPPPPL